MVDAHTFDCSLGDFAVMLLLHFRALDAISAEPMLPFVVNWHVPFNLHDRDPVL